MMKKPQRQREWWLCLSVAAVGLPILCLIGRQKDLLPSRDPGAWNARPMIVGRPPSLPTRDWDEASEVAPMIPRVEAITRISPVAAGPAVKLSFAARLAKLLEAVRSDLDQAAREDVITWWLGELTKAEVPSALIFMQTAGLNEDLKNDLTARLARRWAEDDVYTATDWVDAMPAGEGRALAMEDVAIVRANRDLSDASTWALALPGGLERDRVILAVANEAVRMQPRVTLSLATELPDDPASEDLVRRAAMEYAAQDEPAAMDWARQLSDVELRAHVMAGVAVAWSERDPENAAAFAVQELPEGRQQNDAIVEIIERWTQTDPQAAVVWVNSFPAGELRQAALDSMAMIWSPQDASQAVR